MDIKKSLTALNTELKRRGRSYELYCCGGAALQLLGVTTRETGDVDLIVESMDHDLNEAKIRVAQRLRINEDWLNNKVNPIAARLPPDWKENCTEVFSDSHLVLFALSRQDLISSKLHAAVDRHAQDYDDLILLAPTLAELKIAEEYTLRQNRGSETYSVFVKGLLDLLKKDLGTRNE